MKVIRDIWLCDDCTVIAVNGDASSLDYYYDETDAEKRLAEIERGLGRLPNLVSDDGEDQRECRTCGHTADADDFHFVEETYDEDAFHICSGCGSFDTDARESGREEFSRRGCDCCDSTLAGSFTRFAQLVYEETA